MNQDYFKKSTDFPVSGRQGNATTFSCYLRLRKALLSCSKQATYHEMPCDALLFTACTQLGDCCTAPTYLASHGHETQLP
jgi:hypothetical protein